MKKQYIQPEIDIVEVRMHQLLAGSEISMGAGDKDPGVADGNEFDLFDTYDE